jgi:hypothetical protein
MYGVVILLLLLHIIDPFQNKHLAALHAERGLAIVNVVPKKLWCKEKKKRDR